jgi:acetyl esterase/lipase
MDDFNANSDNRKVSPKPNALILFNPFMGVADTKKFNSDAGNRLHIKGTAEKILPMSYASQKQPPCIMFFGTADKLLEGAQIYQKTSLATKNSCKIVTYQGQGHGFFNFQKNGGKHYKLTLTETDNFLTELGWLAKIGTP